MKKVLSLFMAVVMLFTLTAGIDFSASAEVSGDYGYTVLDDGTAEITDYTGSATDLIIPSTIDGYNVTSICNYAFEYCDSLTSVTIPDSVTSIGDYVFSDCYSLTSVTIPNSVTSIGVDVFAWCDSLTSITVDSNNTNYSSQDGVLFDKNKTTLIQYPIGNARTSYTIPNSVTSIGYRAFSSSSSLTSVTIPNSVTSIGDWAFLGCGSLTSVTIPDSVTSIGDGAFDNCDSLTSITVDGNNTNYSSQDGVLFDKNKTTLIQYPIGNARTSYAIPNSVTSIGDGAFDNCDSLTSITVDSNNTNYSSQDGVLFDKNKTTLIQYPIGNARTSYTIPNSVTSIGCEAFEYCTSLISVTIPNSVTSIGDGAFDNCDSLTSVTIPNSVTSIGKWAFYYCYSLTSVTIGNSVKNIDEWAFYDCCSLTDVYYTGTIDEWNLISIGGYNECLTNANIRYNYVPVCNHIWNNGIVTINPTCTANGVKTFTCTACGVSYTEPIPAISHNFGNNSPSCLVCGIGNPYYVAPTQPAPPTTEVPTTPPTTQAPTASAKETTTKTAAVKKPKTESIKKLSKGKKSFKAYWKKLSGVTGYQIQYSTSKKFTKKTTKTVTVKGSKTTSKTIKKLKGGKKYYVRVRAYNKAKINGKTKTAYGSWSKIKTVTTKK